MQDNEWDSCTEFKSAPTYDVNGDARMDQRDDGWGDWVHIDDAKELRKRLANAEVRLDAEKARADAAERGENSWREQAGENSLQTAELEGKRDAEREEAKRAFAVGQDARQGQNDETITALKQRLAEAGALLNNIVAGDDSPGDGMVDLAIQRARDYLTARGN